MCKKTVFVVLSGISLVAVVFLSNLLGQRTIPADGFSTADGTGLLCWFYLLLCIPVGILCLLSFLIILALKQWFNKFNKAATHSLAFWSLLFPFSLYTLCFSVWSLFFIIQGLLRIKT